jgi:hypothetical protein
VYHGGNAWTPHKALRRVTEHLLDHHVSHVTAYANAMTGG